MTRVSPQRALRITVSWDGSQAFGVVRRGYKVLAMSIPVRPSTMAGKTLDPEEQEALAIRFARSAYRDSLRRARVVSL